MNCKQCGAPMTLSDEFCPYCGALNEPARKHIQDMARYNYAFQNTRTEVLRNAEHQSRSHARVLIIILLVVANIVAFVAHVFTYDLAELYHDRQIHANAAQYQAQLEEYETTGNYPMLARYYSTASLYDEKSLRHFSTVSDMARYYCTVVDNIYYLTSGIENYTTKGEQLQRIGQNIGYFYENYSNRDNEYRREMYTEQHLKTMADMEQKMLMMLRVDCGLTKEDTDRLPEMENQEIMLLIGRRMGIYE